MPADPTAWIHRLYEAFNARNIDAILDQMAEDVDWPNAWEGGRLIGHDAVRNDWIRQWTAIDPSVDPIAIDISTGRKRRDGRRAICP